MFSSENYLYLGFSLHLSWGDASAREGLWEGFFSVHSSCVFFASCDLFLSFKLVLLRSTKISCFYFAMSFIYPLSPKT